MLGAHSSHAWLAPTKRKSPMTANRRGIAYIVAGMGCLVLNDSIVKYVGATMSVAQLISVRGVMAAALLLAVARATGALSRLAVLRHRMLGTRVVCDALTTFLFVLSLVQLPIANATAINLGSPLIMALLAVLFLDERPGARRWLAIGAGFAGILLIIQPRIDGFNAWSLVCLLATVAQSVRDLVTRRIPRNVPAILVAFAAVSFITLIAIAMMIVEGWRPMAASEVLLLAVAAILLAAGYWFLVNSMRYGEISVVAPFRYVGLLVALTTGLVVWGDVPSPMAWSGIALVIGAGVYLLHEERRKRAVAPAPA
jgi:drug/metabolite transporter (DMT)-like permease